MPLAPLKDPWQQVPLLEDTDSSAVTSNDVTAEEQAKRLVNN